jgi:hypothetical protein
MNQRGYKDGRQVILQRSLICRIYKKEFIPYVFALTAVKWQSDSSSEAHLHSSKTSKGAYLDKEVYIFVKIFEFYLVTQSLQ